MLGELCIIHTSLGEKHAARQIARRLVEERLAACVQISAQGESIYQWQGKVQQEGEFYLTIKTGRGRRDAVISWLKDHHPYDVPEIVVIEAEAARAYVEWVENSTGPVA
jgi:periplasmic divalent cation tolerance protein